MVVGRTENMECLAEVHKMCQRIGEQRREIVRLQDLGDSKDREYVEEDLSVLLRRVRLHRSYHDELGEYIDEDGKMFVAVHFFK